MDWVTLGEEILKLGLPLLASAVSQGTSSVLPAILGEVFNATGLSPNEINTAMQADAAAAEKLKQIEIDQESHIAAINAASSEQPTNECS